MKNSRSIKKLLLLPLLFTTLLSGADLSSYRGFELGMSLNAAVKYSGMDISEVTTIHQRPARIQELTWNPQRFSSASRDTPGTAGSLQLLQWPAISHGDRL
jgi:hypothetical protein